MPLGLDTYKLLLQRRRTFFLSPTRAAFTRPVNNINNDTPCDLSDNAVGYILVYEGKKRRVETSLL